jgi:hypothetical protein
MVCVLAGRGTVTAPILRAVSRCTHYATTRYHVILGLPVLAVSVYVSRTRKVRACPKITTVTFCVASLGFELFREPRIFPCLAHNRPSTRPIGRSLPCLCARRFSVPRCRACYCRALFSSG